MKNILKEILDIFKTMILGVIVLSLSIFLLIILIINWKVYLVTTLIGLVCYPIGYFTKKLIKKEGNK